MLARIAKKCRPFCAIAALVLVVLIPSAPAVSEDSLSTGSFALGLAPSPYPRSEISGGVDAARDQWLAYSSVTLAPWSTDLYRDGWRVRFGGGYGQYGYDASHPTNFPCGHLPYPRCIYGSAHYTVDHDYAEALLGYYLQLGRLTAKAFAGASMSSQHHRKPEPGNTSDGTEYGGKIALELWLNVTERSWTSLDVSYATARDESSARWRFGWRLQPAVSFGPELRYDKNVETGDGDWNGRAGLFGRYEWTGGEVSLAGGVTGRMEEVERFSDPSAYGTLNVLFQY